MAAQRATLVYTETDTVTTNQFGLITHVIGSNGNLDTINWGNGAKYLQVEIDITGGTSFTDMGTAQLMSVPYALYAANAPGGGNRSARRYRPYRANRCWINRCNRRYRRYRAQWYKWRCRRNRCNRGLPEMTGLRACRELQGQPAFRALKEHRVYKVMMVRKAQQGLRVPQELLEMAGQPVLPALQVLG